MLCGVSDFWDPGLSHFMTPLMKPTHWCREAHVRPPAHGGFLSRLWLPWKPCVSQREIESNK